MNCKKLFLCLSLLSVLLKGFSQSEVEKKTGEGDSTFVNSLIEQSKKYLNDSPSLAVTLAIRAKTLAENIHYPKGKAYALKNIGISNVFDGKYLEAIEHFNQSLNIFKEIKDNIL